MASEIIEVGVDWVTATCKPGRRAAEMFLWGASLLRQTEQEHNRPQRATWQRYSGEQCGSVFLGERSDGTCLRLSGDTAQRWWQRTTALADSISRLDTQVTWRCEPPRPRLGELAWGQAIDAAERVGRPPTITKVEQYKGGYTLYLGARSSDRFGRLYDKYEESNEDCYKNCWRYELELKQEQALGAARAIANAVSPSLLITSTVHAFFNERGVHPPFTPTDTGPFRRVHVEQPDDVKRYEWLRDTILPVVEGLQQRGMAKEVNKLFGIGDSAVVQ